jgi:CBS domain-containing protein
MPRNPDGRDEEYRARRGPEAEFDRGRADYRPDDYERGHDRRGARPRPAYEYDERDVPRGGRRFGLRGDYDAYVYGRGDHYLDEEYYAGARGDDRPPRYEHPRGDYRERGDEDERRGSASYDSSGYAWREPAPRRPRRGATRSHLRCRDIMTRDVTVAARDTTLDEVARRMRDEDTGIIPVVEVAEATDEAIADQHRVPVGGTFSGGRLVGLITDRDIVVRALAEGRDARQVRAEEIMSTDLHTAMPNDRVIEVIRQMGDKQVRRIPIVDREGNLRGIISMADVALETEADRELAEAIEEISSGHSFWNRIFE